MSIETATPTEKIATMETAEPTSIPEEHPTSPPVVVTKPVTPAWGRKPTPMTGPAATAATPPKAPSLAEIMAEQTEDKRAAQMIYNGDQSLVETEREQARILGSLTTTPNEKATVTAVSQPAQAATAAMDEDEMLRMVLAQSMAEFNATQTETKVAKQNDTETKTETTDDGAKFSSCSETKDSAAAPQDEVAAKDLPEGSLSAEESAAIEAALREADAREAANESESLALAMQLQEEMNRMTMQNSSSCNHRTPQGNVRTMTRSQLENESQRIAQVYTSNDVPLERSLTDASGVQHVVPLRQHPSVDHMVHEEEGAGFRMNAGNSHQWTRRDRNTIVGPNNEVRTKHDVHVQGQANAHFLGLDADDFGLRTHVGNKAFNSFKKSMKTKTKGVDDHGTGRAGTDSDGVKGKVMDANARLHISQAINAGLLEHCNGAVKQGKEAIIYHADKGPESHGYDVAVKIFKRITEFRSRGDYVDGDPRYARKSYRKASDREQLSIWAEKEFRNLIRAERAKVPVPTPLHFKDNIIFMRFLGNDGWPAPQLREIELRNGSKRWNVLYSQVMEAVRRLYVDARLVHGYLSEYNILIAPAFQVRNTTSPASESTGDEPSQDIQSVLIDFGQAVQYRHPEAMNLLERDLDRVNSFFKKKGVKTMSADEAKDFVIVGCEESSDTEDLEEPEEPLGAEKTMETTIPAEAEK